MGGAVCFGFQDLSWQSLMQLKILSDFFLSQEVQKQKQKTTPAAKINLACFAYEFLNAKKQKQKQHDCKEDTHRRNPARTLTRRRASIV